MANFHKNPLPDPVLDAGTYPEDFPGPDVPETVFDLFESSIEQVSLDMPYAEQFGTLPDGIDNIPELQPEIETASTAVEAGATQPESPDALPLSHGPSSQLPLPYPEQSSFSRNFSYPVRRMGGGSTGIRNKDGGMFYCHKFDEWVDVDDCKSCPAFEPDEFPAGLGSKPGCKFQRSINAGDGR